MSNAEVAPSADLVEVASSADLAGDVTDGVTSSAVAEVASSADIAEVVSSAVAEVASSAVLAEVVSSVDLAGNFTISVTSLADPVSVATAGVAFREECGYSVMVPSGSVCDYDDYFYDIMTINRTILTMMIRVTLIVTLVCMALLGRIIMSCIMIYMARMTVGYIVYLGVISAWCHTGVEMRKRTCMRVVLPCPRLVLTSRSICWGIVLLVHSGRVAPVMRKVTFMRVMLPCPGPVPTSRSIELLVHPGQVAPVMRKVTFMREMLPCPRLVPTSQSIVLLVQSARDETGSVADVPGDAIVGSALENCREIDRGTLDNIRMWRVGGESVL